ncbi:MAG: DMT family transporter [Chloroflexota bacterium]
MGVIFALVSAAIWGGSDFCGGVAARRLHQFQVLLLGAASGLALMVGLALWRGEPLPTLTSAGWALAAGVCGAVGIATLYQGLALGNAAMLSPTAGVIGAAIAALVGALLQGLPSTRQLAGFAAGLTGIWLVSQASSAGQAEKRRGLWLALVAGTGFGGYFVFIAQVQEGTLFAPLAISKVASLMTALAALRARRLPAPAALSSPLAVLTGFLDAGGNIFYLLAEKTTRLDVAAVLSSMYPAGTVLLAWLVQREHVTARQWLGVGLCLAAVALIAG